MEHFNAFLKLLEEKFPSVITLIAGIFSLIVFFASVDSFFEKFIGPVRLRGLIYLLFIWIWVFVWIRNKFQLPKNEKGKVGIVVAIFSENEEERKKLKSDFILEIRKSIQAEKIEEISDVIFLKNHFSKNIIESKDPEQLVFKYGKRTNAHLFIWGDIKKRPDGKEEEKYFISFQGLIIHKPISQELKQQLSRDFSMALPSEISFSENHFKAFEATAKIFHLAAKYIIGLAAFVSQDPQLALKLHSGLKQQLSSFKPLPPNMEKVKEKLPILISREALWIAQWHYLNSRNEQSSEFVQVSIEENSKNYGSWLLKAILDFSNKDIQSSFDSLEKAEQFSGGKWEWRYSKAFLYFWTENYQKALSLCVKIRSQAPDGELATCNEVIEFNKRIINSDDCKPQLYFWTAYISYFKKHDLVAALENFESFEKKSDNSMQLLKNKSAAFLQDIRREMGLK